MIHLPTTRAMVRNRYLEGAGVIPSRKRTENNEELEVLVLKIQSRNIKEQRNNTTNIALQKRRSFLQLSSWKLIIVAEYFREMLLSRRKFLPRMIVSWISEVSLSLRKNKILL